MEILRNYIEDRQSGLYWIFVLCVAVIILVAYWFHVAINPFQLIVYRAITVNGVLFSFLIFTSTFLAFGAMSLLCRRFHSVCVFILYYKVPVLLVVAVLLAVICFDDGRVVIKLIMDNIVEFLIGLLAAVIAIWTLVVSSWVSLRMKRVEVRLACIARFDEFSNSRPSTKPGVLSSKWRSYFRRHWAIKKDQLDLWVAGFVDAEAVRDWFMSDVDYFTGRSGSEITPEFFSEAWLEVNEAHGSIDERLHALVEGIRLCCPKGTPRETSKARLFWLLFLLESKEANVIRRQREGLVGRVSFAEMYQKMPVRSRRELRSERQHAEKYWKTQMERKKRARHLRNDASQVPA